MTTAFSGDFKLLFQCEIDSNVGRLKPIKSLIEAERLDDGWMLETVIEVIYDVCTQGSELELEMLIKMLKASHV